MKPTELMLKTARNVAARIYGDLKWKMKIKNLTHGSIIQLIDEAIEETHAKVKVSEIRNGAIANYEKMKAMANAVCSSNSPRFAIPKNEIPPATPSSNGDPHKTEA